MPLFTDVELVPGDPILSLNDAYNADTRTNKVNLGIGIYCDESGCIPLLRAVQQVEEQLAKHPKPRGYLPIDGLPAYIKATQQLLFGVDSLLLTAGRVATSQTVGGSGALRVAAEVLKQVLPHATVAISRPSWENHRALFTAAGFKIEDYTYFDTPATRWTLLEWWRTWRSCNQRPWYYFMVAVITQRVPISAGISGSSLLPCSRNVNCCPVLIWLTKDSIRALMRMLMPYVCLPKKVLVTM